MENKNLTTVESTANPLTRHLLNSIEANQLEVDNAISVFQDRGVVKYDSLFAVPVNDRIPGLMQKYGEKRIHALVVVLITKFTSLFNVVRPMTTDQIVQCAYDIIQSSTEDYLSIEDLCVFFSRARKGLYGKIYDRLDYGMIFEMLEAYREERHQEHRRLQLARDEQNKAQGPTDRMENNEMELRMFDVMGRMENLKHQLKESKEHNKS